MSGVPVIPWVDPNPNPKASVMDYHLPITIHRQRQKCGSVTQHPVLRPVMNGPEPAMNDHFNSVQLYIQLTVKAENDEVLPFLNTLSTESSPTPTTTWTSSPTIHPMWKVVWSAACMTGYEASLTHRTTWRRMATTFLRSYGWVAIQSPSSVLLPNHHLGIKRTHGIHHCMRGAVHSWWYCHTQEVSVRASGTCAESTAWRSSSGLNCHSAQCWSRSRTLFESILGRVDIESPAAVARATSVRPGEGWRLGWGSTKRPAGKENWRNLRLRSMLGRTYTPSNGRKSQWWTLELWMVGDI